MLIQTRLRNAQKWECKQKLATGVCVDRVGVAEKYWQACMYAGMLPDLLWMAQAKSIQYIYVYFVSV